MYMQQTRVQHRTRGTFGTHEHREAVRPRWHLEMEREDRHHRFGDVSWFFFQIRLQISRSPEEPVRTSPTQHKHT